MSGCWTIRRTDPQVIESPGTVPNAAAFSVSEESCRIRSPGERPRGTAWSNASCCH